MPPLPCVRFRRRTVIEMTPVADLLTGVERALWMRDLHQKTERRRSEQQWLRSLAEAESAVAPGIRPGPVTTITDPLGDFGYLPGWYGVERNNPVCVRKVVPHSTGLRLEFSDELAAVVGTGDIELCPEPPGPVGIPVPLEDGPLSAELVDPVLCLFRHPEESGFWNQITADGLDVTGRIVYADWLDDHDDGFGWVFREPRPFQLGNVKLDWIGAMARVDCRPLERRMLWQFARITGRGSSIPFTLSDGNPVPQFIAYLLGVTRIRADLRLSNDDRGLIADQSRMFGLSLMADLIVGPDDEPVCRITDVVRTIYFLGEMMGRSDVTLGEITARLRKINHP
jgi:uncharacterized protein (TIGR02996 family)